MNSVKLAFLLANSTDICLDVVIEMADSQSYLTQTKSFWYNKGILKNWFLAVAFPLIAKFSCTVSGVNKINQNSKGILETFYFFRILIIQFLAVELPVITKFSCAISCVNKIKKNSYFNSIWQKFLSAMQPINKAGKFKLAYHFCPLHTS